MAMKQCRVPYLTDAIPKRFQNGQGDYRIGLSVKKEEIQREVVEFNITKVRPIMPPSANNF